MMKRVEIAEIALRSSRDNRIEHPKFFSEGNYISLRRLINVIYVIRKFIKEISQLKCHQNYIQSKKNIEEILNN
jgi:hypothetical protein